MDENETSTEWSDRKRGRNKDSVALLVLFLFLRAGFACPRGSSVGGAVLLFLRVYEWHLLRLNSDMVMSMLLVVAIGILGIDIETEAEEDESDTAPLAAVEGVTIQDDRQKDRKELASTEEREKKSIQCDTSKGVMSFRVDCCVCGRCAVAVCCLLTW